jgi:lysophospholipase L1-like esterase
MSMPLTYLALGDSYTIGESVPAEGRWPAQLAATLRGEGTPLAEPVILATTGWTTDELSAAMDEAGFVPPWDLVSLLIGVNNQYRGRAVDEYRGEFRRLLERAVALAGSHPGRVLVLSIPDWGVTPFARDSGRDSARIATELDAYNAAASAETLRLGARWVDITPVSRRHPTLLADDGLHPSAAQYALWAEAALPTARAMLAATPAA